MTGWKDLSETEKWRVAWGVSWRMGMAYVFVASALFTLAVFAGAML